MQLELVYGLMPKTRCPDNCGVCCQYAQPFVSLRESLAIQGYCAKHGIPFRPFHIDFEHPEPCPYLKDRRCSIHPARPFMCRVVGSMAGHECPKCECDAPLTKERGRELFARIFNTKGQAPRTEKHFQWLGEQIRRTKVY